MPKPAEPGHARSVNPSAGDHRIVSDPRELAAATRAGERSWASHPYYAARYGERGVRFTRSDSGWLAALADEDEDRLQQHVSWLGGVLAARGMPQRLLELHLALLAEELTAAVPERAASFAKLGRAARALAQRRARYVDDAQLAELSRSFDEAAGREWAGKLPGIGELLGAAVADERCEVFGAVESVTGWLTDPARFPPEFAAAVRLVLEQARSVASGARG